MRPALRVLVAFSIALSVAFISTPSEAQPKRITGNNYFGCKNREYRDKITNYIVQGDKQAFMKALGSGVASGECILFDAGEEVFVTDTAILSGLLKVRRKGQTIEYWTNTEAVK